jgi:ferritin
MISQKMQEAINDQINAELYSGYLYLAMSAYFQDINLSGFANWMRVQAQEELMHAMKFYDFLAERGGTVVLQAIEQPPATWDSPSTPFEQAYEHEVGVTQRIHNLVHLSLEERDYATNTFLDWFVNEQVEEEASADAIVRKLSLIGSDKSGLFMIDRELATRVFVPPTPADGAAG